jgi:beta-lactamase class D
VKLLLMMLLLDVPGVNVTPMPGECFMLQPLGKGAAYVNDVTECGVATPPAGTFEIPAALIAQEIGLVKDPLARVPWPRDSQPLEAWRQDHSLDSAIRNSVEWYFEQAVLTIGAEKMKEHLAKMKYSADGIDSENMSTLTTNGDLLVTPAEQMDFLTRMFKYELPVQDSSVDVVKSAMQMPPKMIEHPARDIGFEIRWPAGTIVRAKTGSSRLGKERFSWAVGHLETGKQQYVFVARLRANRALMPAAGADVAFKYLNALVPK